MRIETNKLDEMRCVEDIGIGEAFEDAGRYYMVTDVTKTDVGSGTDYIAGVALGSGMFAEFERGVKVRPVEAKVVIE